jgi:hypothetical protein
MAERPHNFLREGVITGFIGATAIAVWFLVVDTIGGRPFYTPIFLGKGVVSVLGKNMMGDTAFGQVVGYTIFHYVAFFVVGIVLTVVVHQAERTPGILAGLLVAVVMMTLGFYMIAAAFTQSALGHAPKTGTPAEAGPGGNRRRLGRRRLPVYLSARGRVLAAGVPFEEHYCHDDYEDDSAGDPHDERAKELILDRRERQYSRCGAVSGIENVVGHRDVHGDDGHWDAHQETVEHLSRVREPRKFRQLAH